ncbi:MAG: alanine racemase, partial [Micrococcales bacterium]
MRELIIDLDAIAHNLQRFREISGGAKVMGVVKANAYGHGMIEVARKLQSVNVDYLGVADVEEALAIRAAGVATKVLAWLHDPAQDFVAALEQEIEIGVSNLEQLDRVAAAAERTGKQAGVHLKVDTGLSRNGATMAEWGLLVQGALDLVGQNAIRVVGIFSHLSSTSEADDQAQIAAFGQAVQQAKDAGLSFELRHLTASDGTISYPGLGLEMVRIGIGLYGLSPFAGHSGAEYGLKPAMVARSVVAQAKRVAAGVGVSYGYLYRTAVETTLALIPVGYAEGLPRGASDEHGPIANVTIDGKRYPVLSRIAMDQFVVDGAVGNRPLVDAHGTGGGIAEQHNFIADQ